MSKYTMLGKKVEFAPSADRFCNLQFFAWEAASKAATDFDAWYINCGNIRAVLESCEKAAKEVIVSHIITPLYNTLAIDYHIYKISAETYKDTCLNLSAVYDIYNLAVEVYNSIIDQLEEERAYREYRKASRAEVVGGGFGLGGALAGMATAGAINMATGAAHSIANTFGNACSEGDAEDRKAQLYKEAQIPFREAIKECVIATAQKHIDIVNNHSNLKIISSFNSDQSAALLESAKNVPHKREELLVEAFSLCPWFYDLYSYIFENFPKERKNIIAISRAFHCDLTRIVDDLLSREYSDEAKQSEASARESKARIRTIMAELGITESCVIDQIESDCLARICQNLQQADEPTCKTLLGKINDYDALPKNKQPYIDKIQAQIEIIWAKEDGDIFDNYLLQLNILDPTAVNEGILFVEKRGRTEDSKKYLDALKSYSYEKIKFTRYYRYLAKPSIFSFIIKYIGFAIATLGLYQFINEWDYSFWTQIFPILAGLAWEYFIFLVLKKKWDLMTINNKVVHSIFTMSNAEFKAIFEHTRSMTDTSTETKSNID